MTGNATERGAAEEGPAEEDSAMEAEFDVVAGWTRDAVAALGPDHAVPAACRGTASPPALTWLGEACELAAGSRLVDAGAGVGGPAAFAAERFGVRPVLVDPMVGACRAARELFGFPTAAGTGDRLPLATGTADAVWCLGVLCTTEAKGALLAALHRVLAPGRPLGLFVLVAERQPVLDAPEGNSFPTHDELARALDVAGFDVVQQVAAADLPATPRSWQERIDRVERAVADAHGDDPRFGQAGEQQERMGRLLGSGAVAGWLLHATAR
ncbi:class I SAM-dependent methyltransferase [Pseudonocardia humida]|uniref:Methyltransferase domain-containing protein n=1 Tax=Pseudonocardia humida TaxID=2800819 RepID=A0ABT0ZSQ9_9PSEU|nr:methyltransferase domain-containing protein [Pseudonocardia humida]MCO1653766.1 methyltransferase domain-containing protein [Pseudonocardia humida]